MLPVHERLHYLHRPSLKNSPTGALIKCYVGEDWIVQRIPSGELKIVLYINTYHQFLPDSAPITFA